MKNKLNRALFTLLSFLFWLNEHAIAQRPVRMGPASTEEIKKKLDVIAAHPDSMRAYKAYVYTIGMLNPQLEVQYNTWMEKTPRNAVIPLAFGTAFYGAEMPQARRYLLEYTLLEPNNADVWMMLAGDAAMSGQDSLRIEYMRKATLIDTANAQYALNYFLATHNQNDAGYKQQVYDFVKRFPRDDHAAYLLYAAGENVAGFNNQIAYLEDLRKLFPPKNFSWAAAGMALLADIYLRTDIEKASALINEMGEGEDWKLRKQIAETLIQADKLEQSQSYTAAVDILNQLKLPADNEVNDFLILKKCFLLDRGGDTKAAYDTVSLKFAKSPTDKLDEALSGYGKKLGKAKEQITHDVSSIRSKTAIAAHKFNLNTYSGNKKLNLNDLKGKVVLLTFWFPGCGPCDEELPHFQTVIDQFKNEKVIYLAINVDTLQDAFVKPFLKNNKYSFIPLRGNRVFASKNYGVDSEPQNFLIDQQGKIIFKDFRIDGKNHRTLELMISSLLKKEQAKKYISPLPTPTD